MFISAIVNQEFITFCIVVNCKRKGRSFASFGLAHPICTAILYSIQTILYFRIGFGILIDEDLSCAVGGTRAGKGKLPGCFNVHLDIIKGYAFCY